MSDSYETIKDVGEFLAHALDLEHESAVRGVAQAMVEKARDHVDLLKGWAGKETHSPGAASLDLDPPNVPG